MLELNSHFLRLCGQLVGVDLVRPPDAPGRSHLTVTLKVPLHNKAAPAAELRRLVREVEKGRVVWVNEAADDLLHRPTYMTCRTGNRYHLVRGIGPGGWLSYCGVLCPFPDAKSFISSKVAHAVHQTVPKGRHLCRCCGAQDRVWDERINAV